MTARARAHLGILIFHRDSGGEHVAVRRADNVLALLLMQEIVNFEHPRPLTHNL